MTAAAVVVPWHFSGYSHFIDDSKHASQSASQPSPQVKSFVLRVLNNTSITEMLTILMLMLLMTTTMMMMTAMRFGKENSKKVVETYKLHYGLSRPNLAGEFVELS